MAGKKEKLDEKKHMPGTSKLLWYLVVPIGVAGIAFGYTFLYSLEKRMARLRRGDIQLNEKVAWAAEIASQQRFQRNLRTQKTDLQDRAISLLVKNSNDLARLENPITVSKTWPDEVAERVREFVTNVISIAEFPRIKGVKPPNVMITSVKASLERLSLPGPDMEHRSTFGQILVNAL